VAGKDRERELARAKFERQQARRAAEAAKRRRRNTIIAATAGVVVVVAGMLWFLRPSTSTPAASATTAAPQPSGTSTAGMAKGCVAPPATRTNDLSWNQSPSPVLTKGQKGALLLRTNCGDLVITMDTENAPVTSNTMAFLTQQGFFDDTPCHRLTTAGLYVLQCGDPTGGGSGGPGFSIKDENLPKAGKNNYPQGTVAMANSGPNTNGSQFFLVYQDTTLPPNYTIWGSLTKGLDIVQTIAAKGVMGGGTDGPPAQPVSIISGKTTLPQ
jgi:peptidyl-prolyl cis-trans isomerase B (cyclophilin B)